MYQALLVLQMSTEWQNSLNLRVDAQHWCQNSLNFRVMYQLFMLHHLPEDLNRQGLSEIARVLKPGGRLLVLDLKGPTGQRKSGIAHQPALMKAAGFSQVEMGRQDS